MSANKRYLLRDSTGHYFKSVSGDGDEAYFTSNLDSAHQFTKDGMAAFRLDYDYIKGRTVLLSREIERNAS